MKKALSLVAIVVAAASCTLTNLPNRTNPDGVKVDGGWHAQVGKGCVVMDADGSVIIESDGTSTNLASLMKQLGSVVGGVFGGGTTKESDSLEGGEGCRGVVDQLWE